MPHKLIIQFVYVPTAILVPSKSSDANYVI